MNNKIFIVVSNYYEKVSNNLLKGSINYLKINNYDYEIVYAPGCFEIPFLIKQNINNYIGFIALGCLIRGETYHFEILSNECSRKIMNLSVDNNKPIGFGILTCENLDQALIRSDPMQINKGKEAAAACLHLLKK